MYPGDLYSHPACRKSNRHHEFLLGPDNQDRCDLDPDPAMYVGAKVGEGYPVKPTQERKTVETGTFLRKNKTVKR